MLDIQYQSDYTLRDRCITPYYFSKFYHVNATVFFLNIILLHLLNYGFQLI